MPTFKYDQIINDYYQTPVEASNMKESQTDRRNRDCKGGKKLKKLSLISELKNDIFNNETDIILAAVQSLLEPSKTGRALGKH